MKSIKIWDGKSPINGVDAETILENRNDLRIALGDIFLVMQGDVATEIQIGKTISTNYNMESGLSLQEIADLYLVKKAEEELNAEMERITNEELQEEVALLSYEVMMLKEPNTTFRLKNDEHSPKFNLIRRWFNRDFWTSEMVQDAKVKGQITQDECDKILG